MREYRDALVAEGKIPRGEPPHTHACTTCGHVWECESGNAQCSQSGVARDAETNGQGPICTLCYHLEMALRIADNRGLHHVKGSICLAQCQMPDPAPAPAN